MTNPNPPSILALIPAYNETAHIAAVVTSTLPHLPVLVVDDGSCDDTAAQAEAAGASVLRQVPNQGKGAALQAGFRHALQHGFQAVITLDADGQHDPSEIPAFLSAFSATGADLIIGERNFHQMPPARRVGNTLGRLLFSWALGKPVRDNQSGYRLISARLMEAMLVAAEGGFEFEVEMFVVAVERGYKLGGVPIRTIYGDERSHIRPLRHIVNFMRLIRQTRRRMHSKEQA